MTSPPGSDPVRSLSVLIPTWNGEAFLDRVLEALASQQVSLPWDVLVIDSGSTDRTLAILHSWMVNFPVPMRVRHIHSSAFNHGDTRNLLAVESSGDLLVYLTQDAIPIGSSWLAALAGNFSDARVGAAYCRNVARPEADVLTRLFSEQDPGYVIGRREQKLPDQATYAAMGPDEKRLLFNLNDVASAFRRSLWERHPFPRTEFGEDVLMARALIEAGHTVVYDHAATVEHSHDYGPAEMAARTQLDGRFNVEWLGRVCVASRQDAETLVGRQLVHDRQALADAGVTRDALESRLAHAEALRRAAFLGLHEGGLSKTRHPSTRMLSKARMRLLYVVHGFPPDTWAGTEIYTLGLALEMQRLGHDVVILSRAPADRPVEEGGAPDFSVEPSEFQGLQVWRMTNRLEHSRLRDSYQQPKAEEAFRQVLESVKPDVVHFQHLIHMSASLPRICRDLGVPTLITVNDYWALCARVQLIRPDGVRCEQNQGMGCLLCVKDVRYNLIPTMKHVLPAMLPFMKALHTTGERAGLSRLAKHAGEFWDIADRHGFVSSSYAACDLVIAPSRFLRQKLIETNAFDSSKVVFSDYGTLHDDRRVRPRRPDAQGRVRFGYIGSLLWYKGVDLLVRAARQLAGSTATLHIYGDWKPESDLFHSRLRTLANGSNAIHFHGRFDNGDIGRIYEEIDVLVVPSVWFENSPITIHEAFLYRTPVVTSDIGGMAELVRDGVDGLHFQTGDADDLAAKLARFVAEPDLVTRLSNFRHVKTMDEDARDMEVRYRQVACIVREHPIPVQRS